MIKPEQIQSIIDISKLLKQERAQYDKAVDKGNNQYDIFQKVLNIERLSHKLHCICVNAWIANYEEERYWEKKRVNARNEVLVMFDKPY